MRVRRQAFKFSRMRPSVSPMLTCSRSKNERSSAVMAREMPPVMLVRNMSPRRLRSSSLDSRSAPIPSSNSAAK
jgi:hypothetical protein